MSIRFSPLVGAMAGFCAVVSVASAAPPPPDQVVTMVFRQNPADPASPVTLRFMMELTPSVVEGQKIGWSVVSVTFEQPMGESSRTWTELYPTLETTDGLWWISHDDPTEPKLGEFLFTPKLSGQAAAADPEYDDLVYTIKAVPSLQRSSYQKSAEVTYTLAAAPHPDEPVKSGTDEIVETHDTRDMD